MGGQDGHRPRYGGGDVPTVGVAGVGQCHWKPLGRVVAHVGSSGAEESR